MCLIYLRLPLAIEAKIPTTQRNPKIVHAVLMAFRRSGYNAGEISTCPMNNAKVSIAIPMLNIWPRVRTVATMEEATP